MSAINDLTTLDSTKAWLGLTGLAISGITKANPAVVSLASVPQTPLISGAAYTLSGINGMTALNGTTPIITVVDKQSFSIPVDTTAFPTYLNGGYVAVSDPLVSRLLTACSAYVQSWLNRTVRALTYTETRNGTDMPIMVTRQYPIVMVRSLTIDGQTIPARPALGTSLTGTSTGGYVYDDTRLMVDGYSFTRGFQNVAISYDAGFQISLEAQTIPASSPYTLTTQQRWSAGDRGVLFASNGAALTAVSGAPATGQYSVAGSVYTFAAADAGKGVLISYGYVPADIEQAVIDLIGEWFKYRERIGKVSQSIEGQSISFVNIPMPQRTQDMLAQYRKVVPN